MRHPIIPFRPFTQDLPFSNTTSLLLTMHVLVPMLRCTRLHRHKCVTRPRPPNPAGMCPPRCTHLPTQSSLLHHYVKHTIQLHVCSQLYSFAASLKYCHLALDHVVELWGRRRYVLPDHYFYPVRDYLIVCVPADARPADNITRLSYPGLQASD